MKINQLLHEIPYGAVVTTAWLASHGVTSDQARKLASSGWLQRVGHGAYCQAGEPLIWESAVFALQASDDAGLPMLWPGGQTALALHGFVHYLPMGARTTHLYGKEAARLPRWLSDAEWAGRMVLRSEKGLSAATRQLHGLRAGWQGLQLTGIDPRASGPGVDRRDAE